MFKDTDLDLARRVSFDATKQPIALTEERTGLVRAANPAFLSLIGLSQEELSGKTVVDLGLWVDEGQRNSFLSCLAIEGHLVRYPMAPGLRFQNLAMYATVDTSAAGDDRLLLLRLDIVNPPARRENVGDDLVGGHQFLSRTATDFLLDDSAGLQTRIVRELRTLVPYSIVLFSSFDPKQNELTLRSLSAPAVLDPIVSKYAGLNLDKVVAHVREADRASILRCDLYRDDAYLPSSGCPDAEVELFSEARVPAPPSYRVLATELGVDSIWNIALAWDGEAFGVISILLRKPDQEPDHVLVETFVRQASVALLRNKRAFSQNSALFEKENLLREIHHRVKNNLQIVASLLNLQTERTSDPNAMQVLAEAADRVQSMALVHTMLYGSETLSSINAAEYLKTLATQIVRGATVEFHEVELNFNLEPLVLDAYHAVPAGLIVNELVTNALKYGVGMPGPGTITLSLSSSMGRVEIAVSDSGGRLPHDFYPEAAQTLGMQLVSSLTRQLNGTLETSVGEETCFRIHFPV